MNYMLNRYYITIKKELSGCRLDKVIPALLTQLSRGEARKLIEAGAVSIGGKRIRTLSRPVAAGETVVVHDIRTGAFDNRHRDSIRILLDDPWFVVISKPAGMPADATRSASGGTVAEHLSRRYPGKQIRAVHRLDMGTSGLMIISKTPAATSGFGLQFQKREVEKSYIALVHGHPEPGDARIVSRLDRDGSDPRKFRSVSSGGREAITEYTVESVHGSVSVLKIRILTGRTHQIRVHLSERGNPLVGDHLYGHPDDSAARLMLHAGSLVFRSPRTGEKIHLEDEIPEEFRVFCENVSGEASVRNQPMQ